MSERLLLDTDWMKGMKSALAASRTELIPPLIDLILLYATPPFLVALHPLLSALQPFVRSTVRKARPPNTKASDNAGPPYDVTSKFSYSTSHSFRDWLLTDAPDYFVAENSVYALPPVQFLSPQQLIELWDGEMRYRCAAIPELMAPGRRCGELLRQFVALCGGERRVRIASISTRANASALLSPMWTQWETTTEHVWIELDALNAASGDEKSTKPASVRFPLSRDEYARNAASRWSVISPMKERIARTFGASDDGSGGGGGSLRLTFESCTLVDTCVIL